MDKSGRAVSSRNRSGSGRHRFLPLLVVVLLAGIAGWFWLAGEPEFRERLSARLRGLEELAIGLVTDVHDKLNGQPPAPEVGATAGDSLPGAPPHRDDPIETSEDLERAMAETVVQEGGASVRGPVARPEAGPPEDAGRKDDSVVQVAFINDLAAWLKQGYAANSSGLLTVNLQEANLRYGVGMRGLAWIGEDLPAGRSAALAHVYTRDMLYSLYNLYIDRFMDAVERSLEEPSGNRQLTPRQKNSFYARYAREFRGLSGTLQGIAALSGFSARMDDLRRSAQNVVRANSRYSELVFARDAAQERGENARVAGLQEQVAEAGRIYQQAVVSREQSRDALALAIKKNGDARRLDNDTVLFVAAWVDRRVRSHPAKMDATLQAATLFLDLAQRFEAAGQAALKTEDE